MVAVASVRGVDLELLAVVLAGQGTALDAPLQEAVEQHLGANLGAVRIHTGPEADILSEQAGRMALTVGDSIIFGQGSYQPATPEGQRLLADQLAAVLDHGHGAPGPLLRATGGGEFGLHGEGVGAGRPLSAASLFAGTGAAAGAQAALATHLLPIIRQVYARTARSSMHPHALVGNVRAAERPNMVVLHDSGAPAVAYVSASESARRQTMEGHVAVLVGRGDGATGAVTRPAGDGDALRRRRLAPEHCALQYLFPPTTRPCRHLLAWSGRVSASSTRTLSPTVSAAERNGD